MRALIPVFRPPIITGNTTLNEGDTLDLDCDASNHRLGITLKWLNPDRVVVSNGRTLEIMNIQGSGAGTYTCVVTRPLSGATTNSTVNVTIQCKCQVKYFVLDIHVHNYVYM